MGTIVLVVLLIIAAIALRKYVFGPLTDPAQYTKGGPPMGLVIARKIVPAAMIGLAVLILIFSAAIVVKAGHVGVVREFGKVSTDPLNSGLHFVAPWKDVSQMTTQIVKYEHKYDAASVDIQAVTAVVAVNVALRPACAPEIYRTVGVEYLNVIIDPAASESVKAVTALHAAGEILNQRPKIKDDIQQRLTAWLTRYCLDVKEVSIKNIDFDKKYMAAVEEKQVAQQLAQKKRNEVEQAKADADSAIAKAKGEGDAIRASAQGQADALRIRGDAEASYNRQVSQSLSEVLIQKQYLDKWNGELPNYMLGGGSGVMMQLPIPQPKAKAQQ